MVPKFPRLIDPILAVVLVVFDALYGVACLLCRLFPLPSIEVLDLKNAQAESSSA